ncbi:MAG TPA: hypothetical protein VLT58_06405, partial [Polyangia bacterium]|nr:hypothetical protein [Polyangia bacterium]
MKPLSACAPRNGVRLSRVLVPVLLASSLIAGSAPAAESDAAASAPVTAKWVSRKLHYVYQG